MRQGILSYQWSRLLLRYRTEGVLACLVYAGYLPMVSMWMGLKNDALKVSYPVYRFLSESLRTGQIPWWHYNLHFGFPMHADPGSLFWNPLLWIFSLLGSSLQVYTYFLWFHVLIGAIGFFRLMRFFRLDDFSGVCLSLVFVFSGFYAAHIQHPNYLLEAAWVPWVLLFSLRLLYSPRRMYTVLLAISLFFLINSGYPAFPVGMAYFMVLFLVCLVIQQKRYRYPNELLQTAGYYILAILLAVILSLPYLVSLFEVLPYYYRAADATFAETYIGEGGMNGSSLVALLFPLPTGVEGVFWGTDISWINIYTGSAVFLLSISILFLREWRSLWPFYVVGIFFLLISLQGDVKAFLFSRLPLLGYFRNNGVFRIFMLIAQLLAVSLLLQRLTDAQLKAFYNYCLRILLLIYILTGALVLYSMVSQYGTRFFSEQMHLWTNTHRISTRSLLLINSMVMIGMWGVFYFFSFSRRLFMQLIALDVYLHFLLCLPFTGLGIYSATSAGKQINQWLLMEAEQTTSPGSWRKVTQDGFPSKYVMHPALYLTSPANHDQNAYPSVFRNVVSLWNKHGEALTETIKPVRLKKEGLVGNTVVRSFYSPGSLTFQLQCVEPDTLLVAQNQYPHWIYEAAIQSSAAHPLKSADGFMAIPVNSGQQTVQLSYHPTNIIRCFWASLVGWFIGAIVLIDQARRRLRGSFHMKDVRQTLGSGNDRG